MPWRFICKIADTKFSVMPCRKTRSLVLHVTRCKHVCWVYTCRDIGKSTRSESRLRDNTYIYRVYPVIGIYTWWTRRLNWLLKSFVVVFQDDMFCSNFLDQTSWQLIYLEKEDIHVKDKWMLKRSERVE